MSETISYPNLIAGTFPRQTDKVIIAAGANLVAGAILGKITVGALSAVGAAVAGNTGNGTITGAPTVAAGTKPGTYRLVCQEPYADKGTFILEDPDGITLGVVTVGTAYSANGLTFTIADGSTDFAAGDSFTITVTAAAGSGQYKLCDKTATDGSQNPCAVLAEDAGSVSAVAYATVYKTGAFNSGAVSLATGTVAADVKAALEALNIYLVTADNNVNVC